MAGGCYGPPTHLVGCAGSSTGAAWRDSSFTVPIRTPGRRVAYETARSAPNDANRPRRNVRRSASDTFRPPMRRWRRHGRGSGWRLRAPCRLTNSSSAATARASSKSTDGAATWISTLSGSRSDAVNRSRILSTARERSSAVSMVAVRTDDATAAVATTGLQPLPWSTTRRIVATLLPPIQMGGWGFWVGASRFTSPVAEKVEPVTGCAGSVQIRRNATRYSSKSSARLSNSTPSAANSERR